MTTKRMLGILIAAIIISVLGFVLPLTIGVDKAKEQVDSTQGIRIIGSTVFYDGGSTPTTLKVNDILLGTNEQVFRVNEIRKSHDNQVFVVVSWKYILDYKSYEEYASTPYRHYRTYDLKSFLRKKQIVTEQEVEAFYTTLQQQKPSISSAAAPVGRVLSSQGTEASESKVMMSEDTGRFANVNKASSGTVEQTTVQEIVTEEQ